MTGARVAPTENVHGANGLSVFGAMQMAQRKGLGLGSVLGLGLGFGLGLGLGAHELWVSMRCAICIAPNTESLANEGYSQTLNIHSHVGCCVYV